MRSRLSGAKNSGTGTVPAISPKKRLVCSGLARSAAGVLLADAVALREDAETRGWDSEVARHARVIAQPAAPPGPAHPTNVRRRIG